MKIKALRSVGSPENNMYLQIVGRHETYVTSDTAIMSLLAAAFTKGAEVMVDTDPATGPGPYHKVTNVYVGEWS